MKLPAPTALALLIFLAGSAAAAIPLDNLAWRPDSQVPTPAGLARRVQAYYLLDVTDGAGVKNYWDVRWQMTQKYGTNHKVLGVLVAEYADPPQKNEKENEYWVKARDQSGSLLRAFAGDALGALVIVDGNGKVVQISRLAANHDVEFKTIESMFASAAPMVDNEGMFPLHCQTALRSMKYGDVKSAFKDARKLGDDGAAFTKILFDQANKMLDTDAKSLADPTSLPVIRMLAIQRMTQVMTEFSGLPATAAAVKAIKSAAADKGIAVEQASYDMFNEYVLAMRKTNAKKGPDVQKEWLIGIMAKFPGTYGYELARMVKMASRLEFDDPTAQNATQAAKK